MDSWDTTSVTSLDYTFMKAGEMNSDLSKWSVAKVTRMVNTFRDASKFAGTGVDAWDVAKVTTMGDTFLSTTSLTTCNKRKIADAWKSSTVFVATSYDTDWAKFCLGKVLTDAEFRQATWDWVQDSVAAAAKWKDIGDWEVSAVKTFKYAFSIDRDATGTIYASGGNPKAQTFSSFSGLSKWITTSVTDLHALFAGANAMNVDLGGWDVSKVRKRMRREK